MDEDRRSPEILRAERANFVACGGSGRRQPLHPIGDPCFPVGAEATQMRLYARHRARIEFSKATL
jgi:hypothetical protein